MKRRDYGAGTRRHAPINEQGVVYVFGMVSRELGFYIEAVQQGFPDCEGKYLYSSKKNLWAKARIEFEFKASSFRLHGHGRKPVRFHRLLGKRLA